MPRSTIGMSISHAALGVVVLGAVATAAWHLELIHTMKPGESVKFAGFEVRLEQVEPLKAPTTSPSAPRSPSPSTASPTPP